MFLFALLFAGSRGEREGGTKKPVGDKGVLLLRKYKGPVVLTLGETSCEAEFAPEEEAGAVPCTPCGAVTKRGRDKPDNALGENLERISSVIAMRKRTRSFQPIA